MVEKVSIQKAAKAAELKTVKVEGLKIQNPPDGDRIPVVPPKPRDPIVPPKDNPFGGKTPLKKVVKENTRR